MYSYKIYIKYVPVKYKSNGMSRTDRVENSDFSANFLNCTVLGNHFSVLNNCVFIDDMDAKITTLARKLYLSKNVVHPNYDVSGEDWIFMKIVKINITISLRLVSNA